MSPSLSKERTAPRGIELSSPRPAHPPSCRKLESSSRKLQSSHSLDRGRALPLRLRPACRGPQESPYEARSGRCAPRGPSAPCPSLRLTPTSWRPPPAARDSLTRAIVAVAILRPSRPPRAPQASAPSAVSRDLGFGRGNLAIHDVAT